MRHWAVAVILFSACGSKQAPAPEPASAPAPPAFTCDDYAVIIGEAGHTPTSPGDNVAVQVYSACGCPSTVNTTGGMALRIHETYDKWHAAGCGPINCDEPCSPVAPAP